MKIENIEEILKRIGRQDVPADVQAMAEETAESFSETLMPSRQHILWRTIMKSRITKLAAAAVIVVALIIGVPQFVGSIESVAWGELADKVGQIRTCLHRGHTTTIVADQERTQEMEVFVSSDYGVRTDMYFDGKLQFSQYMLLAEEAVISVHPEQKGYMRIVRTDEQREKQRQGEDAREMIKLFMSAQYAELGRDVIDGIEVEGIETSDPNVYGGVLFENFVSRLWVDVETDLPVRIETEWEMQMGSGAGLMQMSMVMDGFEWDVELEPGIFEPNIPADYNLIEVDMPDAKDEGELIQGLRSFAEIADGRYPSSMTMMAVMQEYGGLVKSMGFDPTKEPTPEQTQRLAAKMMVLQAPYIFYAQLVQENKGPAYYGDKVTAEDVDMVLMRWKVSDNEYRVIFGDLTAENISVDQLAELEALLPQ
jgi:hypothetical protein